MYWYWLVGRRPIPFTTHVTVSHGIAFLCLHKYISISGAHMVYPALPVLIWQPACQPSIVKVLVVEFLALSSTQDVKSSGPAAADH